MIHYFLLISRQGKVRLSKYFDTYTQAERTQIIRDVCSIILDRSNKLCNFIEYGNGTLIYKKYASLYFIVFCDRTDNYIEMLEQIHHYVECLDKYFHNVCELDLIFNFYKTYFLMDEIFLYGHMGETSKKQISHVMKTHDNIYNDERIKMKK